MAATSRAGLDLSQELVLPQWERKDLDPMDLCIPRYVSRKLDQKHKTEPAVWSGMPVSQAAAEFSDKYQHPAFHYHHHYYFIYLRKEPIHSFTPLLPWGSVQIHESGFGSQGPNYLSHHCSLLEYILGVAGLWSGAWSQSQASNTECGCSSNILICAPNAHVYPFSAHWRGFEPYPTCGRNPDNFGLSIHPARVEKVRMVNAFLINSGFELLPLPVLWNLLLLRRNCVYNSHLFLWQHTELYLSFQSCNF